MRYLTFDRPFLRHANERAKSQPQVYVEMRFKAPKGPYTVWVRGKTDMDNGYTDSVWVQVGDEIGTVKSVRMGNWAESISASNPRYKEIHKMKPLLRYYW